MFRLAPFTVAALALISSVHGAPRRVPDIYDIHHVTLPRPSTGNVTIPAAEFTLPLAAQLGRKENRINMLKRLQPNVAPVAGAYHDMEYLVPVTIGGQVFNLILDTGSSDTWVTAAGYGCYDSYGDPVPQDDCNFGPSYYDPAKSATYKSIPNQNMYIGYGDGSVAFGDVATETVNIAGLAVPNQEIAVVSSAVWQGDGVSNGLLGLAYRQLTSAFPGTHSLDDQPGINNVYYDPFFTTAVKNQLVSAPYFSIAVNRATIDQEAANAYHPNIGSLSLGGIASVPVTQTSAVVPVQGYVVQNGHKVPSNSSTATKFFYTVDIQAYQFPGSEALGSTFSANTILDSGTTFNYLPTEIADKFAASTNPPAQWNGVSTYIIDCDAQVPELHVRIHDTTFTVDPKDQIAYYGTDEDDNRVCRLATTNGGDPSDPDVVFILGATFLHNVVTTYNIQSNEVTITQRQPY